MAEKKKKVLKMPKALGACVDLYFTLRAARLEKDKEVGVMKEDEGLVREHLIRSIDKQSSLGAVGKTHKAIVVDDIQYTATDWPAFYKHVQKTGEFDLLNKAINQAAVKERVADQIAPTGKRGINWKPKLPPGIGRMNIVKLSVTKI